MQLRITDGTTTVTLSGDGATLRGCTYVPLPGDVITMADVVEPVQVIVGGAASQILTTTTTIERLFAQAREYTRRKVGKVVYVEYQAYTGAAWYRAELRDASPAWANEPIRRRLVADYNVVQLDITWTRQAVWEASTAVQIPIANRNGGPTTSGLRILNHYDGLAGHDNFVDIDASKIEGVLPVEAGITLMGRDVARTMRTYHIANGVYSSPSSVSHILECENASGVGSRITDSSHGTSNAAYRQVAASAAAVEFYWPTSAFYNEVLAYSDSEMRLLLRVHSISNPFAVAYIKASIRIAVQTYIVSETDEIQLSPIGPKLVDLGKLTLPELANTDTSLVITLRASANTNVNLDFIQLTPTDGYRVWPLAAGSVAAGETVVDDPSEGLFYKRNGTQRIALPVRPRGKLWLYPGKRQRVYVLCERFNGMFVNDDHDMTLFYRPRRLTLT